VEPESIGNTAWRRIEVVITGLTRNQVSYAECQTAETLGTMRVPAEFKLNNVACSILLFFPISTG